MKLVGIITAVKEKKKTEPLLYFHKYAFFFFFLTTECKIIFITNRRCQSAIPGPGRANKQDLETPSKWNRAAGVLQTHAAV